MRKTENGKQSLPIDNPHTAARCFLRSHCPVHSGEPEKAEGSLPDSPTVHSAASMIAIPMGRAHQQRLRASTWQRFTKIVLPALSPITFFLLVTNLTYAFFEVYATIDFMTKGAPAGKTSVAIYEIIRVGVNNGELGRGAAQSVLLFIAVIAITMWQFRTSGERVSYGGS
jgi:ABC-type molybdate transport system permease subunit